jgi:hypothetical protein
MQQQYTSLSQKLLYKEFPAYLGKDGELAGDT